MGIAVVGIGVGGAEVEVTTTGVGGAEVLVGNTNTPWVALGTTGCWVMGTGLPLAGNLHDVMAIASIIRNTLVKMIFLFIVRSLGV